MSRRHLVLAGAWYLLLDVGAAQVLRSTPLWGPEAVERRYRIDHPVYHHDLASNVNLTGFWGGIAYPLKTNSLGFRDRAVRDVPRESRTPRLLLIGDSFTEGLGVAFPDTYAGLLRRALAGRGIEVMNAGVMSYSPSIYYRKLKYLLEDERLRFEYVVVALDLSDIGDEAQSYRMDASGRVVGRPRARHAAIRATLKERSLLVHVADLVWDASKAHLADPARFTDWTTDSSEYRAFGAEGLALATARMDDLSALLESRGIGLAIVVYPYPSQVYRQDSTSRQVRVWSQWATARGVPFFNLFPGFLAGQPRQAISDYFIPHDVHWSARGHRLVATTLLQAGLADTVMGYLGHAAAALPR
jgi:lysophospholipase L1-like esterase